jgi:Xaa-Pro aminopeptidase
MASHDELARRLDQVRGEMARRGMDVLLVGPSTDLRYLTGLDLHPSERLTLLVLPADGAPRLVIPRFELPVVSGMPPGIEPLPWDDGEDPAAAVAALLGSGRLSAGLSGQTQLRFRFAIEPRVPHVRWMDGDTVLAPVRARKSPAEIEALRAASATADRVLADVVGLPIEGMTERELVTRIRRLIAEHGNDALTSGLAAFGPNSASPHHESGARAAAVGDAVIVDFGGARHGYRADVTRTFSVGTPSVELLEAHRVVCAANAAAFAAIRPGVAATDVDAVAREVIAGAGLADRFTHRLGHGIGLDVHEPPYLVAGEETVLEAGMVFTVEPGVYVPGRFGVRVEDVVLVTADGAERLNGFDRSLLVVA